MKQKNKRKTNNSRRVNSSRHTRKNNVSKAIVPPGPCQCNPSVGESRPEHGCIPVEVLQRVAEKLKLSTEQSGPSLRKAIETALSVPEKKEHTFVNALPLPEGEKKDLIRMYLRPPAPKTWESDPDEWLDSNNIADVLNQFEEKYPYFEFMGPFPIDFAAPDPYASKGGSAAAGEKKCLITEICELRVKKAMESGTTDIGIVYNLDPHFKGGSHWVSNYIDIPGHVCYYFDSYGMEPPAQVKRFMQWLTTQDPEMKLHYSSRRLQYSNTECGVYSIYFIAAMLLRKNVSSKEQFLRISRKKPSDADMLALRKSFFST